MLTSPCSNPTPQAPIRTPSTQTTKTPTTHQHPTWWEHARPQPSSQIVKRQNPCRDMSTKRPSPQAKHPRLSCESTDFLQRQPVTRTGGAPSGQISLSRFGTGDFLLGLSVPRRCWSKMQAVHQPPKRDSVLLVGAPAVRVHRLVLTAYSSHRRGDPSRSRTLVSLHRPNPSRCLSIWTAPKPKPVRFS